MAKIPFVLYISAATQLLPSVAWIVSRRRSRAAAAIAIGGIIGVLSDIVGRVLAAKFHNNHIASIIDTPMIAICFLYALREWQVTAKARRLLTVGSILLLLGCVFCVAILEDIEVFDSGVVPLSSLVIFSAAMWTLFWNSRIVAQTSLRANDWFWASLGLALQGAASAVAIPFGGVLLERDRVDLFMRLWEVRGVVVIASYCLIGWGIYCGPVVSKIETVE